MLVNRRKNARLFTRTIAQNMGPDCAIKFRNPWAAEGPLSAMINFTKSTSDFKNRKNGFTTNVQNIILFLFLGCLPAGRLTSDATSVV